MFQRPRLPRRSQRSLRGLGHSALTYFATKEGTQLLARAPARHVHVFFLALLFNGIIKTESAVEVPRNTARHVHVCFSGLLFTGVAKTESPVEVPRNTQGHAHVCFLGLLFNGVIKTESAVEVPRTTARHVHVCFLGLLFNGVINTGSPVEVPRNTHGHVGVYQRGGHSAARACFFKTCACVFLGTSLQWCNKKHKAP